MVWRPSFVSVRPQVQTSPPKQLGQSKPNFVFIDGVFVMGRGGGANVHVIHFYGGGGQMSSTFFESGGKYPPLLIIGGGGQMSSYTIFHRGQMSEGGKCPTLLQFLIFAYFLLYFFNLVALMEIFWIRRNMHIRNEFFF